MTHQTRWWSFIAPRSSYEDSVLLKVLSMVDSGYHWHADRSTAAQQGVMQCVLCVCVFLLPLLFWRCSDSQSSNYSDLTLVKVTQAFTLAYFSRIKQVATVCLSSNTSQPLTDENQCYSLHLREAVMFRFISVYSSVLFRLWKSF